MKKLLLFLLVVIGTTYFNNAKAQTTYEWVGASGNNWTTLANWKVGGSTPATYPGQSATNDIVNIGYTTAFTNQPTLNIGGKTIGTLNMGFGSAVNLTLNNSITTGAITLAGQNVTFLGTATSTLTAASITSVSQLTINTVTVATTGAIAASNTITLINSGDLTSGGNFNCAAQLTVTSGNSILTINGGTSALALFVINSSATLDWNGSGTTTCGGSGNTSVINAIAKLTVGVNANINFTGPLSVRNATGTGIAELFNNGDLIFTNVDLTTFGYGSAITSVTNAANATMTFTGGTGAKLDPGAFVTVSNSGTITGNASSSINANNTNTKLINNATGTITLTGTTAANAPNVNINGNTAIVSNIAGGLISLTRANVNIGGNTASMNNAGTVTAITSSTINVTSNPSSYTNSTTGSILNLTNSAFNLSASTTFNNSGTVNATTSTFTCNGNPIAGTNSGTMNLASTSTITLSAGTTFTNSGTIALTTTSTATFTGNPAILNNTTASSAFTFSGSTLNLGAGGSITNAGTISATASSALNLTGNPATIVNNLGSTFSANTSPISIAAGASITNNGATFTATSSNISLTGSPAFILNQNSGSTQSTCTITTSNLNFVAGTYFRNVGSIFTTTNCPYVLNGNPTYLSNENVVTPALTGVYTINGSTMSTTAGSRIDNYGTFNVNLGAVITVSGNSSNINNFTTGNFNLNASTISLVGVNSIITNQGTFTASNNAAISTTTSSSGQKITNSGTFYAGTSNSPCIITLNGNGDIISSSKLFYLGSTSIIYPNVNNPNCTISNSTPGGTFTLQSDQYGSATIGNVSTGTPFQGYFNVERFFTGGNSAGNRGYRIMSSPVNQSNNTINATNTFGLTYLNQHTYLNVSYAGIFTGGIGSTGSGFSGPSVGPTIYLYKEDIPSSNAGFTTGKHVGISAITTSGTPTSTGTPTTATVNTTHASNAAAVKTNLAIPIGNGFLVYFVGPSSRTSGSATAGNPFDATMSANGYINQGTFTVNLWYNTPPVAGKLSYAATVNPGYNLVGNPYPATINLNTVLSDNNTSINAIYVLNSRMGGAAQNYVTYVNGGTSSPTAQGFAVSGGGFLVHAINSSASLTFKESQKAPTQQLVGSGLIMSAPHGESLLANGGDNMKSAASQTLMSLPPKTNQQTITGLYMKMEKDSLTYDYCGIYFRDDYSAKYDDRDALYLTGQGNLTMSSLSSDGLKTSVNMLPDYHAGSKVKLNVTTNTSGLYSLKLEGVRNIDEIYDIYLLDHFKKDSLDIRRYGAYNFNVDKADTTTYGSTRFELSIRRKPLPTYVLTDFAGNKVKEGVKVNWTVQNESNYTGFTLEKQNVATSQFEPIFEKQSDGSGNYDFVDVTAKPGDNVYRLKQNDIDNKISYTPIVNVFYAGQNGNGLLINVFPNPTVETINVSVSNIASAQGTGNYKLNIYDMGGSLLMQKASPTKNWSENISTFKTGAYIVEVINTDGKSLGRTKFVKK